MKDKQLKVIEERCKKVLEIGDDDIYMKESEAFLNEDIPALLTEVRRLKGESDEYLKLINVLKAEGLKLQEESKNVFGANKRIYDDCQMVKKQRDSNFLEFVKQITAPLQEEIDKLKAESPRRQQEEKILRLLEEDEKREGEKKVHDKYEATREKDIKEALEKLIEKQKRTIFINTDRRN